MKWMVGLAIAFFMLTFGVCMAQEKDMKGVRKMELKAYQIDPENEGETLLGNAAVEYDEHGTMTKLTQVQGIQVLSVVCENTYDAKGRWTEKIIKAEGLLASKETRAYANDGSFVEKKEDFEGEEAGKEKAILLTTIHYDVKGKPVSGVQKNPDGREAKRTYRYDAAGNCTKLETTHVSGTTTEEYMYDAKNRLVETRHKNVKGALTHRTTQKWNAKNDSVEQATYDADGVLTRKTEYTYTYNAQGRHTERVMSMSGGGLSYTLKLTYEYELYDKK